MYVYKYEKGEFEQPFLSLQPKHIFIGKSKVCEMTEFCEANDNSDFDGNTILLECQDIEYVYISGHEIFKFKTDDKIIDYISIMDNNLCPYTFAIGDKYTYFKSTRYNFIENDKIEERTLLNATNDSLDPFDYHLGKSGVDSFKTIEHSQFHSFYPHIEEDTEGEDDVLVEEDEDVVLVETNFCIGTKEVVKIFNQKC